MHLSEFQAWFEGFTEEMKGPPNKDQWAKIKKRIKEITADYTPAPVFIRDYIRPWRRYWDTGWYPTWIDNNTASLSAQAQLTDWSHAGQAEYRSSL